MKTEIEIYEYLGKIYLRCKNATFEQIMITYEKYQREKVEDENNLTKNIENRLTISDINNATDLGLINSDMLSEEMGAIIKKPFSIQIIVRAEIDNFREQIININKITP